MTRATRAVALGLIGLALPASAHAADFSSKSLTFTVKVGPDGATPCRVVADLYAPAGASKDAPVPAMLATNGFAGSKADFGRLGPAYAKRGFAFLAYSGLGFGGSGCKIQLDDPDWDGKAASELVSFLGGSRAADDGTKIDYVVRDAVAHDGSGRADDPRVGMIGGSYGGQVQFALAGIDPRVDAINPQITWNDLAYSLVPNNTDFAGGVSYATPGVAGLQWPTLFSAAGVAQGTVAGLTDPSHLGPCPGFDDRVCLGLARSAAQGYADETTLALLRHASVGTYMQRIRIPTFLAQGQHDTLFDLQEAVATYKALRAQGTPVKLLWRSSGHSGGGLGTAESNASSPEQAYESRAELEWFDWYLKGVGDPPALDFAFFRDFAGYRGDAAPAVGSTPSYPAADDEPLLLSGTGALVGSGAHVQAGTSAPVAVAPGGNAATSSKTTDAPGTFAAYTSQPLPEDVDVAGIPSVTVRLDAPTFAASQRLGAPGQLVLFAKLYDVDASGKATLPQDLLSPARVGDVTKPVRIELPGIVHRFAKGHRLRLVLAAGDALHKTALTGGTFSVTTGPASPGVLTIPRLGAVAGAAGTGPNGAQPYVPARSAPPAQRAGLGGPPADAAAASLPSARTCASRRRVTIRLRRPARGDRIRSAVVTVNGRRRTTVKGRALRVPIDLRGLPKGSARVVVLARTVKGRTLRSARTYRTCVRSTRR